MSERWTPRASMTTSKIVSVVSVQKMGSELFHWRKSLKRFCATLSNAHSHAKRDRESRRMNVNTQKNTRPVSDYMNALWLWIDELNGNGAISCNNTVNFQWKKKTQKQPTTTSNCKQTIKNLQVLDSNQTDYLPRLHCVGTMMSIRDALPSLTRL